VGSKAGQDVLEKRKNLLPLLGIEPHVQAEADSLYRLSHSGFVWCGKELTKFSQESTALSKHGSKFLRNVGIYLTILHGVTYRRQYT
jgi:hypothetical protein